MATSPTRPRQGTRLPPAERRSQILEHARRLFAQRPYQEVSSADIAREAGVTRALVHHYFGGVRDVYLVVVGEMAAAGAEIPGPRPGVGRRRRVAENIAAWLDVVEANREAWLATAGHGDAIADQHVRDLLAAGTEAAVDRMIAANADLVSDTPATRFALRSFMGLGRSAIREWLTGGATRAQVEALLVASFLDIVERGVPRVEAASGGEPPGRRRGAR
ncbi:MAG: helix-turn-helix domain-containing protein [Solirubrobacteraceae bacterium]